MNGRWKNVGIVLLCAVATRPAGAADPPLALRSSPGGVSGGEADGGSEWAQALRPREFVFPRDHASHEDYRIEWWYYTGNVQTADGRPFGYQVTFFRTATAWQPKNPSRWAVRDLYTAHFAVSDLRGGEFLVADRLRRHGVGWAGAATDRYHVWNGDWQVTLDGDAHRLRAATSEAALELSLVPQKPMVLHGERGLSRKGPTAGNASYYYSFTRMQTAGRLTVRGREYEVSGLSWMDHEFSTSFLEPGQQGWDWICLQLEDGRELMIYQIRRAGGEIDRLSSGTLVDAAGGSVALSRDDFQLVPGPVWKSPRTGGAYPTRWTVRLPGRGIELEVEAALVSQELDTRATTGIAYWEGAVTVRGRWDKQPVRGRGYLEMTGYGGRALGGSLPVAHAARVRNEPEPNHESHESHE